MLVFRGRNVHQLFPPVLEALLKEGVLRDSRNGQVLMFREPVTTVYERPRERVLWYPERDANPFFHLIESAWMLDGRRDVSPLAKIVPRMAEYSDDGETFHGAYGYRWRNWFGRDQLELITRGLQDNPDDRRQVLTMWDAREDLGRQGKDLPCNLQAIFQISCEGKLDMTVTNRSNDIIWGAYGANVVHFSILQEYMAVRIGRPVGIYRQVSMNFHAYTEVLKKVERLAPYSDPYEAGEVSPGKVTDLRGDVTFAREAYLAHKAKFPDSALESANLIRSPDWRRACREWLYRRAK